MRKILLIAAAFALPAALPAPAAAEEVDTIPVSEKDKEKPNEDRSDRNESVTYSGFGLTRLTTDFENLKDAVNLDFSIGFRVPTFPMVGAELVLSTTVIPGENQSGQSGGGPCGGVLEPPCGDNQTSSGNDLQTNSVAVYGVFRSPGRLYAMGRFGYRYLTSNIEELQREKSGSTFGGGVGYRWGESLSGIEVYYNRLTPEVDQLGFSIVYGFGGRGRDRDRD